MSYIEEHLNRGENLIYRTTLHPFVFVAGGVLLVLGLVTYAIPSDAIGAPEIRLAGTLAILLALAILLPTAVRFFASEFGVTTARVIIKTGWLSRRTLEVQLAKMEAVSVEETLAGRMFDYGSLVVGGTGGTKEKFRFIRASLVFKRHVQEQAEAVAHRHSGLAATSRGSEVQGQAGGNRQERECPHCAEKILVRANRCRFCNQDVPPIEIPNSPLVPQKPSADDATSLRSEAPVAAPETPQPQPRRLGLSFALAGLAVVVVGVVGYFLVASPRHAVSAQTQGGQLNEKPQIALATQAVAPEGRPAALQIPDTPKALGSGANVLMQGVVSRDLDPGATLFYLALTQPVTLDDGDRDGKGEGCDRQTVSNLEIWDNGSWLRPLEGKTVTFKGTIDCPRGGYVIRDITVTPSVTGTVTQKSPVEMSDDEFATRFQCPETFPSDEQREVAAREFLDWATARHGDWRVSQTIAYRMQLLKQHMCEGTPQ
jgi:hypothetical protein